MCCIWMCGVGKLSQVVLVGVRKRIPWIVSGFEPGAARLWVEGRRLELGLELGLGSGLGLGCG